VSDEPQTEPTPRQEVLAPVHVPMLRIVEAGMALWALAFVVTLLVPTLHQGTRNWWPWVCVWGVLLGGIGWLYLRRGRGNAADA
jgi:hypothetical protein